MLYQHELPYWLRCMLLVFDHMRTTIVGYIMQDIREKFV